MKKYFNTIKLIGTFKRIGLNINLLMRIFFSILSYKAFVHECPTALPDF